ncbi:flagellar motor protein MotB [Shewanella sp.]|nr:flagellar motor protein MotB [Shewanella sp.]
MAKKSPCDCPPPGAPLWLATFADLMSLLMCFFILLLAFSELDVMKFKQIAGSMKYAFGVQNKVEVKDIPKGTSVIALEFRPGRPESTPIEIINQQTTEMTEPTLEFQAGDDSSAGGVQQQRGEQRGGESSSTAQEQEEAKSAKSEAERSAQEQINQQVKKMAQELNKEIVDGAIEIESLGQQIIIRIREKGAFASGSGFLQPRFKPIVKRVGALLKDVPGIVTVSGHTDDWNIANELYSSNWDLSSKRAVAVAHEMIKVKGFDQQRLKVVGMASSAPLVENNSQTNRARNRRVEIAIEQGKAKESAEIRVTR